MDVDQRDFYSSCSFGDSRSVYSNRSPLGMFYTAFIGFSTAKSFSYLDKWRLPDAPNRQVRRAMEKDNKKARDGGRRLFNDTVRNLAQYVRKRDPRYKSFVNAEQQKREEKAQREMEKEKEKKQQAPVAFVPPAWMQMESDGYEVEEEVWECVACDKIFKSERAFNNHSKTKVHQSIVKMLQDMENGDFSIENQGESEEESEEEEEIPIILKKKDKKKKTPRFGHEESDSDVIANIEELKVESQSENEVVEKKKKRRRQKQKSDKKGSDKKEPEPESEPEPEPEPTRKKDTKEKVQHFFLLTI